MHRKMKLKGKFREQEFSLAVRILMSHIRMPGFYSEVCSLVPESSFLPLKTLGGSGDGLLEHKKVQVIRLNNMF